jgi:hypothetical protein
MVEAVIGQGRVQLLRSGNKFLHIHIDDYELAQSLLDAQVNMT